MDLIVNEVGLESILPLRSLILRQEVGIAACIFSDDKNNQLQVRHYALFENSYIKACLSLYGKKQQQFRQESQWQLRGMAVDQKEQGRGFGKKILEDVLSRKECQNHLIWCNARSKALSFYEKHGFKKYGQEFLIEEIGPHYVAYYDRS